MGRIRCSSRHIAPLWLIPIILAVGCVSSALPASPSPAPTSSRAPIPDVAVSTSTNDYEISGVTENDLRAQMDALGPSGFDAYTAWLVRWTYPDVASDAGCAAGPVKVSVLIVYTFPQWDAPPDAPADLVEKWNAYVAALQLHEEGHKDIALEAGNEVRKALSALKAYPSCEALRQSADAAGESVLDKYRRQEAQYDQTTDHGATQGARFP
jgi:predicted secreted Zn-dependent protease